MKFRKIFILSLFLSLLFNFLIYFFFENKEAIGQGAYCQPFPYLIFGEDWPIAGSLVMTSSTPNVLIRYSGSLITGSGSSGRIAFWTGSNTLSSDNNLFWDNTNKRLGLGTTAPSERLHVIGNAIISGTLTATNISGTYAGTINAANVSSGQFGASTGGGDYYFMGNVGIGTTTPGARLDVRAPDAVHGAYINTATTSSIYYALNVVSGGTSRLYVRADGNVGIGTTNPGGGAPVSNLDVAGFIAFNRNHGWDPDTYAKWGIFRKVRLTSSPYIEIQAEDGNLYGISIWLSSKRAKTNITDLEIDSSKIYDLKPVSFNWKNSPQGTSKTFGLIAEDTAKIIPELVAFDENKNPHFVRYDLLSVLLLDQLQKIRKEIIINNNGNIGIGTIAPDYKLRVEGTVASYGYVNLSDISLKKGIRSLDSGILDKVLRLNPVSFYWKDENLDKDKHFGFIAQEVEKIFPELVREDSQGKKTLNYNEFIPFLVKAIQEQQKEIEELKSKLKNFDYSNH